MEVIVSLCIRVLLVAVYGRIVQAHHIGELAVIKRVVCFCERFKRFGKVVYRALVELIERGKMRFRHDDGAEGILRIKRNKNHKSLVLPHDTFLKCEFIFRHLAKEAFVVCVMIFFRILELEAQAQRHLRIAVDLPMRVRHRYAYLGASVFKWEDVFDLLVLLELVKPADPKVDQLFDMRNRKLVKEGVVVG